MAYACGSCERAFGSARALEQHQNDTVCGRTCTVCDKMFGSARALAQHVADVHPDESESEEEMENVVALDIERVGVIVNGKQMEAAASVCLVDGAGEVMYESFIRVAEHVVSDLRTHISGVRMRDLRGAPGLARVRRELRGLLDGKVCVGHTLDSDLSYLGIAHSPTVDIAELPLFRDRRGRRRRLRTLAWEFLRRRIQVDGRPHSASEDAKATVDLYAHYLRA